MTQETYRFVHDEAKGRALVDMANTPVDGAVEWIKRPIRTGKTLAQLGGMFGVWIKHVADQTGDDEDHIHRMLKAKFLARIYITDPQNDTQAQWVELLAVYQEQGDVEKLKRHAKRISLSWANIEQMKSYMSAVDGYYANNGIVLPFLDKFRCSNDKS